MASEASSSNSSILQRRSKIQLSPIHRGVKFTKAEKDTLVSLVKKYREIVTDKYVRGDAKKSLKKNVAWDKITSEFNECCPKRNKEQLRQLWYHMRTKPRDDISYTAFLGVSTQVEEDCEWELTLLQMVQEFPCVYDVTDPNNKNMSARAEAWRVLGERLGKPAVKVQKRFKNIRNTFRRLKIKREEALNSGCAPSSDVTWHLYPHCGFLDVPVATNRFIGHFMDEPDESANWVTVQVKEELMEETGNETSDNWSTMSEIKNEMSECPVRVKEEVINEAEDETSENSMYAKDEETEYEAHDASRYEEDNNRVWERVLVDVMPEYPFLYDVTHPSYKSHSTKAQTWREVSLRVGRPVEQCKLRWKSMRDSYMRRMRNHRRPSGNDGSIGRPGRRWHLQRHLRFLDKVKDDRRALENLTRDSDSDSVKKESIVDSESGNACSESGQAELSNGAEAEGSFDTDIEAFFQTMAATVKNMSPANQIRIKMEVCRLVGEVEMEELKK